MLDCEDWRVCHGVLSACWSVKIGIGRGCVTGCSLHVGLGIGRRCVTVCSLHVGLGIGRGCVISACWSVYSTSRCALCMLVCENWHRQRVCHGVLSARWSVKIGTGSGCVTVCSLHVGL